MNYIDNGTSGIVKFLAYAVLIVLAAYCADRVYNKKYNDCVATNYGIAKLQKTEDDARNLCSTYVK